MKRERKLIYSTKKESLQFSDHNLGLCVLLTESNRHFYDLRDIPL